MRLIDADKIEPHERMDSWGGQYEFVMVAYMDDIDALPTVDAVLVVRCQDCKWYQPDADKWCGYFECMGFEPDDYCSQGERKDGDDEKTKKPE